FPMTLNFSMEQVTNLTSKRSEKVSFRLYSSVRR
ncbi:MAG TPA: hypothetical protein DHV89_10655, partial [Ruminococcus sp.]|nr:hypothetical protein [Ruminococcus sp.]